MEASWAPEGGFCVTGTGILAWIVVLFHIAAPQVGVSNLVIVRELTVGTAALQLYWSHDRGQFTITRQRD
jgi:hypothetical protein